MHKINETLAPAVNEALKQMGQHVRTARLKAYGESREAFAKRLGCAPMTLDRIEDGEPGVAIVYWLAAMQAMEVLYDVTKATNPALLIATQVPTDFPTDFDTSPRP